MAIMKWDPFREMETFQERISRLFEESGLALPRRERELGRWYPSVDIFESDNEIIVKAELPEVEEKDIDVKIENNVLTISGKRSLEREEKKEGYHLIESSSGSFTRSFSLPATVDPGNAAAKLTKGVLRITLPKKPEAKTKQIQIKVSS